MSGARRRAVFLDRDGVLNRVIVRDDGNRYSPACASEIEIYPDVLVSLLRLKRLGFELIVVTNQPDVARGILTVAGVEEIHGLLQAALPLDGVFTCFHDDAAACSCRKPLPGLLLQAARSHGIDLGRSYMVGDRWRDVDAGAAAGCRTVWIDRGYGERPSTVPPDGTVQSLGEAADWIEHDAPALP